jgi:GDPmannose 4,6-dehydratase
MKNAFITGITGQDGSYLAELLLEKGYRVHGLVRRSSTHTTYRIDHLTGQLHLHEGDMGDAPSLKRALERAAPDEIYHLAAMSHVKASFEMPEYTADVDGVGVLRFLEAVRAVCPEARFYQASTSELYGQVRETPQNENTPFHPRSPYGIAKLFAYWSVVNYREAYGMFACNGILYNHESPRRGEAFVTRKITQAVAQIVKGAQEKLLLGNLEAQRDWGYAPDFVDGMWRILQQERPEDYVLATGHTTTVRRFVELAFAHAGIEIEWLGEGMEERGIDKQSKRTLVEVSPAFFRPAEVDLLLGDASKARRQLGWVPHTGIEELIRLMVQSDLQLAGVPFKKRLRDLVPELAAR